MKKILMLCVLAGWLVGLSGCSALRDLGEVTYISQTRLERIRHVEKQTGAVVNHFPVPVDVRLGVGVLYSDKDNSTYQDWTAQFRIETYDADGTLVWRKVDTLKLNAGETLIPQLYTYPTPVGYHLMIRYTWIDQNQQLRSHEYPMKIDGDSENATILADQEGHKISVGFVISLFDPGS